MSTLDRCKAVAESQRAELQVNETGHHGQRIADRSRQATGELRRLITLLTAFLAGTLAAAFLATTFLAGTLAAAFLAAATF